MLKILDRYLIREIALPFLLALVVLTFVLEIPPILLQGEELISKGVEWAIVLRVLLTLLPQALTLTIPMAVLLGILVAFGRLSGDREFVAMQACGVSLMRLLRPVALVATLGMAATAYEIIVALPDANQTFREIVYVVMATRVESNVKPRVFFEDFPNRVIYVRDLPQGGGWRDVFLADTAKADETTVYFAKEGRIRLDRDKRLVQLELTDGTSHTTHTNRPEEYQETAFNHVLITLDPETVFRRPPAKGPPEMTFAELGAGIAAARARHDPAYALRFMYQQKLSLPVTCPILALIGLGLGATNRKDGKLASFVLGFLVILVYYILLYGARALAMGGRMNPSWAPWVPNIVMGIPAILMVAWRARSADQPIRLALPAFWQRQPAGPTGPPGDAQPAGVAPAGTPDRLSLIVTALPNAGRRPRRVVVVVRLPHLNLRLPRLLDMYLSREYLRVFALGLVALLGIFYISTFIDVADKLFRGQATTSLLLRYFYFQTPQYVYYIIPMAVLVSTLVTIGAMTKNSELIVMRACGVSLYRTAVPLLAFALLASGALFALQEQVLASANREADRLNRLIRGIPPATSALNRRWLLGGGTESPGTFIYHYDAFDALRNRFSRLQVYQVGEQPWRLKTMMQAAEVTPGLATGGSGQLTPWHGREGWTREFGQKRRPPGERITVRYIPFADRDVPLDPPRYFKDEEPDPEQMTYAQLSSYITQLRTSGMSVMRYVVSLQRKVAFPFVTIIMTFLAVPFAVTTGRRGALYGVGVGIVLAIVYWIALSIFGALGVGGVLPPLLAAWAPNILFGAMALYMVLTVRT